MSEPVKPRWRKVVVPAVLAVTAIGTAAAIAAATSSLVACTDSKPAHDAGVGDGQPDTPIV